MGQARKEMLCYLQGQERADGSFLFITASRGIFFPFLSFFSCDIVHRASGLQVRRQQEGL